jgi:hypothetical protein
MPIVQQRSQEVQMDSTLTLRRAGTGDEAAIARVAALDSRRPPTGLTMVAELDGTILAAISFEDGAVVADPFERTADVVQALRLRRRQLSPARRRRGRMLRHLTMPRPVAGDPA